jgi:uncharacterized membrane protein
MFIHPLPEVSEFIEKLNDSIQAYEPSQSLSRIQRQWFVYVLMGIILSQLATSDFLLPKHWALLHLKNSDPP